MLTLLSILLCNDLFVLLLPPVELAMVLDSRMHIYSHTYVCVPTWKLLKQLTITQSACLATDIVYNNCE